MIHSVYFSWGSEVRLVFMSLAQKIISSTVVKYSLLDFLFVFDHSSYYKYIYLL
jgi:hypothetical protein